MTLYEAWRAPRRGTPTIIPISAVGSFSRPVMAPDANGGLCLPSCSRSSSEHIHSHNRSIDPVLLIERPKVRNVISTLKSGNCLRDSCLVLLQYWFCPHMAQQVEVNRSAYTDSLPIDVLFGN